MMATQHHLSKRVPQDRRQSRSGTESWFWPTRSTAAYTNAGEENTARAKRGKTPPTPCHVYRKLGVVPPEDPGATSMMRSQFVPEWNRPDDTDDIQARARLQRCRKTAKRTRD